MTRQHERLLMIVGGAVLGLVVLYLVVDGLFLSPLADARQRRLSLTDEVRKLTEANKQKSTYERQIIAWAGKTYRADAQPGERFGERIRQLLKACNLRENVDRQNGAERKGVFREFVWMIKVDNASLSGIVQLLFLLGKEPYLLRIDDLRITPQLTRNTFSAELRAATIVLDLPNVAQYVPTSGPAVEPPGVLPDSPQFQPYALIASRNVFRPYVPRPPDPPPQVVSRPPDQPRPQPQPQPQPPPRDNRFRVCSLTEWAGQPEVWVRDEMNGTQRIYKPGEALGGGTIVMIDYRPLPKPDKPELNSPSRVILKVLDQYWAVELNENLSQRRRLPAEQLPESLKPKTQPKPPGDQPQVKADAPAAGAGGQS